jgi:hypothetical protein
VTAHQHIGGSVHCHGLHPRDRGERNWEEKRQWGGEMKWRGEKKWGEISWCDCQGIETCDMNFRTSTENSSVNPIEVEEVVL